MRKNKFIAAIIASTMMVSMVLTGCGGKATEQAGGEQVEVGEKKEKENKKTKKGEKLVVWTFTDEVKKMIDEFYLKDNPDLGYEVEVVIVPNEQYQSKIDPALQAGKGAPDLFAIEAAYAKKYLDSDFTMPLADLGIQDADLDDITTYVKDVARDTSGVLKGIS